MSPSASRAPRTWRVVIAVEEWPVELAGDGVDDEVLRRVARVVFFLGPFELGELTKMFVGVVPGFLDLRLKLGDGLLHVLDDGLQVLVLVEAVRVGGDAVERSLSRIPEYRGRHPSA